MEIITQFFPLLIFFGFFALIFTLIILGNKGNKRLKTDEIAEIQDYCNENGLKFKQNSNNIPKCSEEFKFISYHGSWANYDYIMIGKKDEFDYTILDFNYSAGKSRHYNTICLLSKEGVSLPEFRLMSKWTCLFYPGSCEKQVFSNKQILDTYRLITDNISATKKIFNSKISNILQENISNKYVYDYETKAEYLLILVKGGKNLNERLNILDHAIKLYSAMIEKE